jgi:hypothetical protein
LVGIATSYRLNGLGSIPGIARSSRPTLGPTRPPIQWVPGALSLAKRSEHEADHSPAISAEVKKMWIYISIPP